MRVILCPWQDDACDLNYVWHSGSLGYPFFPLQGTARRKKKVVHKTATADDKKLQGSLKKLAVNNIAGIEEVSHQRETNATDTLCVCSILICFFLRILNFLSLCHAAYERMKDGGGAPKWNAVMSSSSLFLGSFQQMGIP